MKFGDIVRVSWDDHSFTFGDGRPALAKVKTCGYFVEETDEYVAVALSIVDGKANDTQLIDKRMLRKVKKVK